MPEIKFEINNGNVIDSIVLSELSEEPTIVHEFYSCRFFCNQPDENIEIRVGNLRLKTQNDFGGMVFFVQQEKQNSYFSQIFINQIGYVSIEIWQADRLKKILYIKIISTKVSQEELAIWVTNIQTVFPLCNIGSDFSPMSNLRVNFSDRGGFFSFSSFAKELYDFLLPLNKNIKRPGFLKRKFSSQNTIGRGQNIDQSKHEKWLDGRIKWKKTKLFQNSLINSGAVSFEPITYPTTEKVSDYNTDMNQVLLLRLLTAESLINNFLKTCELMEIKDLNVRNIQFDEKINKTNLINIIQSSLQRCAGLIANIIYQLNLLGVQKTQKSINYDTRFVELTSSIVGLDVLLKPLRQLDPIAENSLALPSTDQLFEYFSYAVMVHSLQSIGFEISAIGEDYPVPFFMRLKRTRDRCTITVFFDQTIPYADTKNNFHPLVDKNRNRTFRRPDFIFHINKDKFDTTFIVDAKFKGFKKTQKDSFGNQMNSQHLVAKYTSGISQIGPLGLPPFFILGICLSDDTDKDTHFRSGMHKGIDLLSKSSPLIQSGTIGIGYKSFEQVGALFSDIIRFHNILKEGITDTDRNEVDFIEPVKDTTIFGKEKRLIAKSDDSNWSHTAPKVDDTMAAEIKGMLNRGDKPQDIAFYFGVNNGRISEIKSGDTFEKIEPALDNLPPHGPYPSVKDLMAKIKDKGR